MKSNENLSETLIGQRAFEECFDGLWRESVNEYYVAMDNLKKDVGSSDFTLIACDNKFNVHKGVLVNS